MVVKFDEDGSYIFVMRKLFILRRRYLMYSSKFTLSLLDRREVFNLIN